MRYTRTLAISGRLEKLIQLIRTGTFSSPNLAAKLAVSEQTVYRDIEFLRAQGYGIEAVRLSEGWAYQLSAEPNEATHRKGSHT